MLKNTLYVKLHRNGSFATKTLKVPESQYCWLVFSCVVILDVLRALLKVLLHMNLRLYRDTP